MSGSSGRKPVISLKARVLAIALVPSFVLLAAGVGFNTYALIEAVQKRDTAELLADGYNMAVPFMPAMSEERRASLAVVANPSQRNKAALAQARQGMDQLMSRFSDISSQVADAMPQRAKDAITRFVSAMPRMMELRQNVDSGRISRLQVYQAFNQIADAMIVAADSIGRDSTDKETALYRSTASDLMRISDWLVRSNSLAAASMQAEGMTQAELEEFSSLTRAYRAELASVVPRLPEEEQRKLQELQNSPEWQQLGQMETALANQGVIAFDEQAQELGYLEPTSQFDPTASDVELPLSDQQWHTVMRESAIALSSMGLRELGTAAAAMEKEAAENQLTRSVLIAVASLVLATAVLLLAMRMGNSVVRRLRKLRDDTLRADERLPSVVQRIRDGEPVNVSQEVPELHVGYDEIGEVAQAFNKAQQTAVNAAVQEAQLREGTNAVFLNIARRSQAVVQRQLQVLDKAERAVEDPDQVELLFQLDHLSTRERRNAENLIILGGGQLGRQWRDGARLIDVVRSAVSETSQYNRVNIGRIPDMTLVGRAVADVVHLLAELVDNAIEFSPPGSSIEVRSNPVGKGTVIEVEDQGIGIDLEDREDYNAMFREPPDFSVMALTQDSRIGFFVVAKLAHEHGIKITLLESIYGGVRAVVLLPTNLTAAEAANQDSDPADDDVTLRAIPRVPAAAGVSNGHSSLFAEHQGNGKVAHPSAEPSTNGAGEARVEEEFRTRRRPGAAPPPQAPQQVPPQPQGPQHQAPQQVPPQRPQGPQHQAPPPQQPQWPAQSDGDLPPLPRRRRQTHLAPQLQDDPAPDQEPEPEHESAEPDFDERAAQARNVMSAFQRGTERGRAEDQGPWRP
ncbi:signal transduction histidine kinase [Saccharomonospora amisosensis]|uniref:histidine kinase n=1 Tax=Saccharomonospora amisosensis TaxID=1128677 RepID=A0A7X5ZSA7_9PSEU|nr:nitrate- and nitrite sensing domain-containing protein [Saccharomonospora amisosensis]NIJ13361.1 signal transduction histidine kinase [Saccharomonospora amisosensis]